MPRGVPRVPEPREWVLKKKCSGPCGETKPWAKFSPASYWPDGMTVLTVQSRCQACQAKAVTLRQRDWRDRNLESRRKYEREWSRLRKRQMRADAGGHRSDVHLPAGPVCAWLLAIQAGQEAYPDLETLASAAGVSERNLRRMFSGEQKTVALRTADNIITRLGGHLDNVYPHEEVAA